MNDIPLIEFVGGGTYTYGALQDAQTILSTARPKSRKYIFLVTDGFSNGKDPIPVAEELKANNVTIFTIGIQSGNYDELYNISSFPKETHSFLLGSFKEFEKLARGALMQDHKLGYSIKLSNPDRCNILCNNTNFSEDQNRK
ncbi:sushi, von Willebrand factor type A, EGF and pentraxin domain-containing protein 1-like [Episyrphus balteatus]|uniref:sushi, von Willebrand factor type A, EGF and pentraxin domain-containing protein 1-like n=1 Tax=Episyrphus balteatus TaxID=286459 RepID=UPI002485AB90|nr:sushi, von Willebrand factor type A, EGF and pentraxin domain-containing protein 1-like [Episyrphus balteatus]